MIDAGQNTAIMGVLTGIAAAVPLAEGQVQLALAGSTASIVNGQALINKNISDAIAASLAKPDSVDTIVMVSRFFDIMLPILAVGALIKYLCCPRSYKGCHCGCDHCKMCNTKK